jgi:hypothetical protein
MMAGVPQLSAGTGQAMYNVVDASRRASLDGWRRVASTRAGVEEIRRTVSWQAAFASMLRGFEGAIGSWAVGARLGSEESRVDVLRLAGVRGFPVFFRDDPDWLTIFVWVKECECREVAECLLDVFTSIASEWPAGGGWIDIGGVRLDAMDFPEWCALRPTLGRLWGWDDFLEHAPGVFWATLVSPQAPVDETALRAAVNGDDVAVFSLGGASAGARWVRVSDTPGAAAVSARAAVRWALRDGLPDCGPDWPEQFARWLSASG